MFGGDFRSDHVTFSSRHRLIGYYILKTSTISVRISNFRKSKKQNRYTGMIMNLLSVSVASFFHVIIVESNY